jgi:dihydroorotate dehydrogenase (NAD+) catalytic subunit
MAIDLDSRRSRLGHPTGGLSGPAIKPVALRMVWQAARAVKIPIIGAGGVASGRDALEFMVAGAKAVQVGTANFVEPSVPVRVADEIHKYCVAKRIARVEELVGTLQTD